MQDIALPVDFRTEIIGVLLAKLTAGESCSLVGVGSSGKSNVALHLNQAKVRDLHLREEAKHVLNLYVNCKKLSEGDYTARELYCLILEVIIKTVRRAKLGGDALWPKLKALWKEAIVSEVADLARFNLDEAFYEVFQAGIKKIIITLDDFDSAVEEAPGPVLNSLRAFRDDYKYQIMYVTFTRRELQFLRDPAEFEDLFELFDGNVIPIGPYTETDARFMVKRLAAREHLPPPHSDEEFARLQECLLVLSGGHAGLLRITYKLIQGQTAASLDIDALLARLRTAPPIKAECDKIWNSLEQSEQLTLESLVSGTQPPGQISGSLQDKGIILQRPGGAYYIFSPVFANFIVDRRPELRPQMQLVPEKQVRIGNLITDELNEVEYRLFSCLFRQQPDPVAREKLLQEMLAVEGRHGIYSGSPEHRLDAHLAAIKAKVQFGYWEYILRLSNGDYRLHISYQPPKPAN